MITELSEHEFIIQSGHRSYVVALSPTESDNKEFVDAVVYEESYGMKSRREVFKCLATRRTTSELAAQEVLLTWLQSLHYHGRNIAQILSTQHDETIRAERSQKQG